MRTGARRSSGRAVVAMTTVNRGIVETSTEATPLSILVSAQAMSVNGMTLSIRASSEILPTVAGSKRTGLRRATTIANTTSAPRARRPAAISMGAISSTSTFMKRKAAPKRAPRAMRARGAFLLSAVELLVIVFLLFPGAGGAPGLVAYAACGMLHQLA